MSWLDRIDALLGVSTYARPLASLPTLDSETVETIREALGGQLSPPPYSQTRWYLADLEAAEHAADTGQLAMAARLMREARKDGVIAGVLSTRTGGLVRLPKIFRGNPDIVRSLELGHDSVRSVFDEMFPPAELELLAGDGFLLGVGVGELLDVKGRDYPVFARLDPEFLVYRWAENRWYYRSTAGMLPITPGNGRWILHTPGGRIAPWQHGLWKAIGQGFIRKQHAALHKDNWEGKLANPARVAVAPQGAAEEQKEGWFQAVMAWGVNTVFGMTPGYDVKLLESNGRGADSFEETMRRCDRDNIVALAGQVVTTDGGAGFQNSDIHRAIRGDLIKKTGDDLAYTINTQGLPRYVVAGWGEEALDDSAVMGWDITPPKDRAADGKALETVASAIAELDDALKRFDRRLDIDALCAQFAIPVAGDADGDGRPDENEGAEVIPIRPGAEDASKPEVEVVTRVEKDKNADAHPGKPTGDEEAA